MSDRPCWRLLGHNKSPYNLWSNLSSYNCWHFLIDFYTREKLRSRWVFFLYTLGKLLKMTRAYLISLKWCHNAVNCYFHQAINRYNTVSWLFVYLNTHADFRSIQRQLEKYLFISSVALIKYKHQFNVFQYKMPLKSDLMQINWFVAWKNIDFHAATLKKKCCMPYGTGFSRRWYGHDDRDIMIIWLSPNDCWWNKGKIVILDHLVAIYYVFITLT